MSWWEYCKDHLVSILVYLGACGVAALLLYSLEIGVYGIVFLSILYLFAGLFLFVYNFWRKRRYLREMKEILIELDKPYLLSEMIPPPEFAEGVPFYQALCRSQKSMNDEIASYRRMWEDYREYIELWMHQIKTPLASSRLLLENHPGEVNDSLEEELDRVDYYLEQALYYARSNTVERDYLIERLPLQEVVRGAVRRYAKTLIRNRVRVEIQPFSVEVYSDGKWLQFILGQLIVNSVKYRGNAPVIQISAKEYPNAVELVFSDNGIGISAKDLPRVCDKGYTGSSGRKYAKSTGMGLYLSKKLAGQMGLELDVRSEGEGTQVHLFFPKGRFHRPADGNLTKL